MTAKSSGEEKTNDRISYGNDVYGAPKIIFFD